MFITERNTFIHKYEVRKHKPLHENNACQDKLKLTIIEL